MSKQRPALLRSRAQITFPGVAGRSLRQFLQARAKQEGRTLSSQMFVMLQEMRTSMEGRPDSTKYSREDD